MAEHDPKQELIIQLDRARARIARNFDAFRHDIDVPAHVRNSVRSHKTIWLAGAAGLGVLLAKLPGRKKKVYVDSKSKEKIKETEKAGLAIALAKLAFNMAKPAITAFATKKMSDFARQRGREEARGGVR